MAPTARKAAKVITPTSATGKATAATSSQRRAARKRPGAGGFTLVELLVVLAIIVVMAGAIVPRMGGSIRRQNLAEATARLAQTCRTVREVAVASGQTCAVELDMDGGGYAVTQQSGSGKSSTMENARAVWLKPQHWPDPVKVASCRKPDGTEMTSGRVSVRFFADGRSDGAAIRMVADQEAYEVTVHPQTGRVVYGRAGEVVIGPDQYDLGDG